MSTRDLASLHPAFRRCCCPEVLANQVGDGRALHGISRACCCRNPVLEKSVSPISSEMPEILDSHLGGIASCCSHHSSSCKKGEMGNAGVPLPHAPFFLLQASMRVLAPSSTHQGGLHFHTGTGQELGTGSQSRMGLAGRSTAGPETSLHGRCSANRAL